MCNGFKTYGERIQSAVDDITSVVEHHEVQIEDVLLEFVKRAARASLQEEITATEEADAANVD